MNAGTNFTDQSICPSVHQSVSVQMSVYLPTSPLCIQCLFSLVGCSNFFFSRGFLQLQALWPSCFAASLCPTTLILICRLRHKSPCNKYFEQCPSWPVRKPYSCLRAVYTFDFIRCDCHPSVCNKPRTDYAAKYPLMIRRSLNSIL